MKRLNLFYSVFCCMLFFYSSFLQAQEYASPFTWPEGKRAALSLSFDDARLSNVDVGTGLFRKSDTKVTFYVVPSGVRERLEGWKQAVKDGHEIGNHTLVHPCSGNFPWARDKALENYNLAAMRQELLTANQEIEELLGVKPKSFAYSCGQTYVGRGKETRSYVPLVAELFESGRNWLNEAANDPIHADLAHLQGIEMDGKDFEKDIKPILEEAIQSGSWVLLAGHEIGEGGRQTTLVPMLEKLIAYVQQPNSGIWMAPVGTVASYIKEQRNKNRKELADALSFCTTFEQGFAADYAQGDPRIYTIKAVGEERIARIGMHNPNIKIAPNKGRFGNALAFTKKSSPPIFYKSQENIKYEEKDWSGTISMWLSLDPEKDLEPGYTDPIQITDVTYNDAALWVDFSDKNPRSFRMGVFGDLKVWNPDNLQPNDNPVFLKRLLPATDRPFGTDVWTHVVISFSNLNSDKGKAAFYINGKHQGTRDVTEPFTWELEKSKIFLGLNYVGLMDEVSLFKRALTEEEVVRLYQLPGGIGSLLNEIGQ